MLVYARITATSQTQLKRSISDQISIFTDLHQSLPGASTHQQSVCLSVDRIKGVLGTENTLYGSHPTART